MSAKLPLLKFLTSAPIYGAYVLCWMRWAQHRFATMILRSSVRTVRRGFEVPKRVSQRRWPRAGNPIQETGEAPFRQLCPAYPSTGGRQRGTFIRQGSSDDAVRPLQLRRSSALAFSEAGLPIKRLETNPAIQKDSSSLAELYEYNNSARTRQQRDSAMAKIKILRLATPRRIPWSACG